MALAESPALLSAEEIVAGWNEFPLGPTDDRPPDFKSRPVRIEKFGSLEEECCYYEKLAEGCGEGAKAFYLRMAKFTKDLIDRRNCFNGQAS